MINQTNIKDGQLAESPGMTVEQWLNGEELPITIWHNKYQHNGESFEEWLDRVSGHEDKVKQLIREQKFIFAGRILSNRGIDGIKSCLNNCFVLTPPNDDLESIFETGAKMARTFSYGGGVGLDVSNLRPKGAAVHNAAKSTSGATSFMDFYSYITGLVAQRGRRGATMLSISCEHPELEDFINLKSDLDVCTKANISVRMTDAFMKAAETNSDFTLHFTLEDGSEITKVVNARDTLMLLAQRSWEMAEPGILYWDRISNYHMLQGTDFQFAGTNPCGELPLPANGACLLGSINLTKFVRNPFTTNACLNLGALAEAVETAILALNQVLNEAIPKLPLKEQQEAATAWRAVGLGTLGLGDMLIMMGLKYGSPESLQAIQTVYKLIAQVAVKTSLLLAEACSAFPKCDFATREAIVNSDFIKNLEFSDETLERIKKSGLYNAQLLTCAPTGTIGTMLQVSTGVEPNFAFSYNRRTVSLNNEETTYQVDAKIVQEYKKATGNTELPDCFVASADIEYHDRIHVQAMLQAYIDNSISSTVNLPHETTIEQIYDLYLEAWKCGLKGVTIFRDGCKRQGILTTKKDAKSTEESNGAQLLLDSIRPISRKSMGVTQGMTFCKKCACGTLYITINKNKVGNIVEVFTHTSKGGVCAANTNGLTRMVSLALRSGVLVEEIKDQLRGIHCPACLKLKAQGKEIDGISCPDILSKTIGEFQTQANWADSNVQSDSSEKGDGIATCPECGSKIEHTSGCRSCSNCGWSKCG